MATATSQKVGLGKCPIAGCGMPVHFKRSSGGKLGYQCGYCDTSGYAQPGGTGEKSWMASIDKPVDPVPPAPAPEPAPQPKKRAGFDLGAL